jgi:ATP-dependent DNA helicase RecG
MKIDLKKILASGENQQVEFKTHFNRETIETLVAFANAEGGEVVLGVTDGGKIIGIESNPESIQNWINEVKMKTEPSLLVDAAVANNDGKSVVVLSVPEYPVKPISMQGRYFKRVNNSNHLLSATEIVNLSFLSDW